MGASLRDVAKLAGVSVKTVSNVVNDYEHVTDGTRQRVRLAIAEHLQRERGERFAPPQLLRDKVARGELGRKTGQGFYSWEVR